MKYAKAIGHDNEASDSRACMSGRLAQLGERRVRNAEVRSSILLPSTKFLNKSADSDAEGASPSSALRLRVGRPVTGPRLVEQAIHVAL